MKEIHPTNRNTALGLAGLVLAGSLAIAAVLLAEEYRPGLDQIQTSPTPQPKP